MPPVSWVLAAWMRSASAAHLRNEVRPGVPIAVGAVHVADLDAVAGAAVTVAPGGLPGGPGGHVLRTPADFGGSHFAGLRAGRSGGRCGDVRGCVRLSGGPCLGIVAER